ncbi:MAG: hypothetical protein C0485_00735 [Pirellula sp.]|nr:hypothetical protein [Pirellula sp.]
MDPLRVRTPLLRHCLFATLTAAAACGLAASPSPAHSQTFAEEVAQASYNAPLPTAQPEPNATADADSSADQAATAKQAEEIDLVRQLARHRGGQPAALAQIIQMSRSFNDAVAAELLDELAAAHLRAGDLNLAADTRRVLAEQYPGTPRAQDALLWLVRLYSSSEMVHARRQPSQAAVDMLRQIPANADLTQARTNSAVTGGRKNKRSAASASQPAAPYAIHLATQSMDRHPELADNAALAYQRAVAARLAGQQKQLQAYLSPLKHRRGGDTWGDCARMEAWLESGDKERSPKPTAMCVFADDPPQLDGMLNEPFWQLALPLPLKPGKAAARDGGANASEVQTASYEQSVRDTNAAATPPAASQVQLAYDREYLYVAAICEKPAGAPYSPGNGPRPRDGDVESHDHVALRLDVDRDYASYYELLIDSRGQTADRCWGDAAWNPEWFVAAGELNANGGMWIVELAIPWSELAPTAPKSGHAWALSLARTLPPTTNQPSQSWLGPACDRPAPENFGVLQFE